MYDQGTYENKVSKENRMEMRGIEVGHVFFFGDKYTKPLKANVQDSEGKINPMQSGSYGIGVSRLVAAIIEASHDEKGIIWPKSISPFDYALLNLNTKDDNLVKLSDTIYKKITDVSSVLYDDTNSSVGEKLNRVDLIGVPIQIILGKNSIENNTLELKERSTGNVQVINVDVFLKQLHNG